VSAEESATREERNTFERSLTMVQHDMKEVQRKLELEVVQRQKAETQLNEVENQLHAEVSARQAALGNNQQSVEKVQQLRETGMGWFRCHLVTAFFQQLLFIKARSSRVMNALYI